MCAHVKINYVHCLQLRFLILANKNRFILIEPIYIQAKTDMKILKWFPQIDVFGSQGGV
jgi:hypothetical protein